MAKKNYYFNAGSYFLNASLNDFVSSFSSSIVCLHVFQSSLSGCPRTLLATNLYIVIMHEIPAYLDYA